MCVPLLIAAIEWRLLIYRWILVGDINAMVQTSEMARIETSIYYVELAMGKGWGMDIEGPPTLRKLWWRCDMAIGGETIPWTLSDKGRVCIRTSAEGTTSPKALPGRHQS